MKKNKRNLTVTVEYDQKFGEEYRPIKMGISIPLEDDFPDTPFFKMQDAFAALNKHGSKKIVEQALFDPFSYPARNNLPASSLGASPPLKASTPKEI